MKAEMMDVLQYIFDRFQDDEFVPVEKAQTLVNELEEVGFRSVEINSALSWLDGLVDTSSENFAPTKSDQSNTRIYHPYEQHYLSLQCRGFLYFLEQAGILDPHSREAVIDRVLALESNKQVDLDQLKWVIMMVLFNIPGKQEAAIWLENMDACFH
jgi:Smg protein